MQQSSLLGKQTVPPESAYQQPKISKRTPGHCMCHALLQDQGPNQLAVSCQRPLQWWWKFHQEIICRRHMLRYQQLLQLPQGVAAAECNMQPAWHVHVLSTQWQRLGCASGINSKAASTVCKNCFCAQKPKSGQDCVVQRKQAQKRAGLCCAEKTSTRRQGCVVQRKQAHVGRVVLCKETSTSGQGCVVQRKQAHVGRVVLCKETSTSGQGCVVQSKDAHNRQFNQARPKAGVACMDYLGPSMQPR